MFHFLALAACASLLMASASCSSTTESGGSGGLVGAPTPSETPAQFSYSDKMLHWENSHEIVFRDSTYTPKTQTQIAAAYQDYAQWLVQANVQNLLVRVPGPKCVMNNAGDKVLPGAGSFEVLAKALEQLGWGGVLWFTPDTIQKLDSWRCWATGAAPIDSWKTYIDVLKNYNDTLISKGVPSKHIFHGLLLEPEGSSFGSDFHNNPSKYGWSSAPDTVGEYIRGKGFSRWTGDPWSIVPNTIAANEIKIGYGIGADELKLGAPTVTVSAVDVDMLVLETYNLDYLELTAAQKPSQLIASNQPIAVADEYENILSSYPTQSNSVYADATVATSISDGEIVFVFSYEQYIPSGAKGVFGNQGWSAEDFANMLIEFKTKMVAAQSYSSVRTGVYHQPEKETLPACDLNVTNCYKGFRPRYVNDWGN